MTAEFSWLRRGLVNTGMNFMVPWNTGNLWNSWAAVSFSRDSSHWSWLQLAVRLLDWCQSQIFISLGSCPGDINILFVSLFIPKFHVEIAFQNIQPLICYFLRPSISVAERFWGVEVAEVGADLNSDKNFNLLPLFWYWNKLVLRLSVVWIPLTPAEWGHIVPRKQLDAGVRCKGRRVFQGCWRRESMASVGNIRKGQTVDLYYVKQR
jgi:hypothetical protein